MLVTLFVASYLVCAALTSGQRQVRTGEPREVSVNNSKVWRAARFAVGDLNQANTEGQAFHYRILTVTSAKVQVK